MVFPANLSQPEASSSQEACAYRIEAFSYDDRREILSNVARALDGSGAFVLERRSTSPSQTELRFEVRAGAVVDLYSLIVGAGLELTRGSHLVLTGLCTLRLHQRRHLEPPGVLTIVLSLNFLEDLNMTKNFLVRGATA